MAINMKKYAQAIQEQVASDAARPSTYKGQEDTMTIWPADVDMTQDELNKLKPTKPTK